MEKRNRGRFNIVRDKLELTVTGSCRTKRGMHYSGRRRRRRRRRRQRRPLVLIEDNASRLRGLR